MPGARHFYEKGGQALLICLSKLLGSSFSMPVKPKIQECGRGYKVLLRVNDDNDRPSSKY
jgi:hypothetical protein